MVFAGHRVGADEYLLALCRFVNRPSLKIRKAPIGSEMRNSAHRPVAHVNALGGNAVTGRMGAGGHNCSRPTCEREKRMCRTVLLTRALGVASGVLIFFTILDGRKNEHVPPASHGGS